MNKVILRDRAKDWVEFLYDDERMCNSIKEYIKSATLLRDVNYNKIIKAYANKLSKKERGCYSTVHRVVDLTIEEVIPRYDDGDLAVLNYASFKNPGGGFLNGSMAQEEALCHVTGLYPILETFRERFYIPNKDCLNYGQYNHSFIVSEVPYFIDDKYGDCLVITSAAPNYSYSKRYGYKTSAI